MTSAQPDHFREKVAVPCTGDAKPIGPASRHIQRCAACQRWIYVRAANGDLPDAYWRYVDDAIERQTPDVPQGEPFEVVDDTAANPSTSPRDTTTPSAPSDGRRDDRGTRPGEPSHPSSDPGRGQGPQVSGFEITWAKLAHRPLPQTA